jgi:hypothetical protein
MAVGYFLAFLAAHGVHASAEFTQNLTGLLTVVLGAAYYTLAHLLQTRWPLAGLLLGSTATPTYEGRHRKTITGSATATSSSPEDRQ